MVRCELSLDQVKSYIGPGGANRLRQAQARDCFLRPSFFQKNQAEVVVGVGVAGIQGEGVLELLPSFALLVLAQISQRQVVMRWERLGIQLQGSAEMLDRARLVALLELQGA